MVNTNKECNIEQIADTAGEMHLNKRQNDPLADALQVLNCLREDKNIREQVLLLRGRAL